MTLTLDWAEAAARAFEPPPRRWATPGALAKWMRPDTVQTPALDLIDAELVKLLDTPDARLIITMPPQEGKSTRVAGDFPTWALTQNPDLRIVTASYAQSLANRNGRAIRRRITEHPDLGLTIAPDNGAVSDWTLQGHEGGVLSVGIGSGLTGRPADLMVIDDPISNREQADSMMSERSSRIPTASYALKVFSFVIDRLFIRPSTSFPAAQTISSPYC